MPNIIVKIPAGVLDQRARAALVAAINQGAAECERIPPDPTKRALCWVAIEEIAAGHLTCGGIDPAAGGAADHDNRECSGRCAR